MSRDDVTSTRGRAESHPNAAALSSHLAGDGVGLAKLGAPEASPHGDNRDLCHDDGAMDGGGNFLAALHTKPDVASRWQQSQ